MSSGPAREYQGSGNLHGYVTCDKLTHIHALLSLDVTTHLPASLSHLKHDDCPCPQLWPGLGPPLVFILMMAAMMIGQLWLLISMCRPIPMKFVETLSLYIAWEVHIVELVHQLCRTPILPIINCCCSLMDYSCPPSTLQQCSLHFYPLIVCFHNANDWSKALDVSYKNCFSRSHIDIVLWGVLTIGIPWCDQCKDNDFPTEVGKEWICG